MRELDKKYIDEHRPKEEEQAVAAPVESPLVAQAAGILADHGVADASPQLVHALVDWKESDATQE